MVCDFIEGKGNWRRAGGPVSPGGLARLRLRARPGPGWAGQPDHHAVRRVAGDRGRGAEEHDPPPRSRGGPASISGRSIPSAPPPRSGRTRSLALLREPLDVMVVVGGYNSSNTCHLAALVQQHGITGLPHRGCRRGGRSDRHHPAPAHRHQDRGGRLWVAGQRRQHRDYGRCLDAEQQGGGNDRANQRGGGGGPRGGAWVDGTAGQRGSGSASRLRFIDLSHTIEHGMTTYPGLPGPLICDYLSREASRGPLCSRGRVSDRQDRNGGEHRDLPRCPVPPLCRRATTWRRLASRVAGRSRRSRGAPAVEDAGRAIAGRRSRASTCEGKAVLVQTGWDVHWRTERYLSDHPFLTGDAAEYLVSQGVNAGRASIP